MVKVGEVDHNSVKDKDVDKVDLKEAAELPLEYRIAGLMD